VGEKVGMRGEPLFNPPESVSDAEKRTLCVSIDNIKKMEGEENGTGRDKRPENKEN